MGGLRPGSASWLSSDSNASTEREPENERLREPGHKVIVDNLPSVLSERETLGSVRS